MRTNYSGFALAVSMGLIVLLIGLLALSTGGLVQLAPLGEATAAMPVDSVEESMLPVSVDARPLPASNTSDGQAIPEGQAIAAGEPLFKQNCAQCHAVNEKVVGPALAGITKRRRVGWIIPWVHNSAKVIASGDDYAGKLYGDYGKQQMPAFPQLSDKDIKNIVAWVEWQTAATTAIAAR